MKNRAEVIVIGGGIIGTAITYYLAKAGKDVLLLERNELAFGSAGASDGMLAYTSKKPGVHLEMAMKSGKMYETLGEELDADLGYHGYCGGYFAIEEQAHWDVVAKVAEEQRAGGLDIRMLEIKEARKLEPALSESLIGVSYSPASSKINPMKVTFAFAKAAKKLGSTVISKTEVQEILVSNGKVTGVKTNKGEYYADYVVNATGSWGGVTAKLVGLDMPIKPRRGQIVVTEPVGPLVKGTMLCGQYFAVKHRPDLVKEMDEKTQRLGVGFGVEQTEDGTILLSNTREWVGYDNRNTLEGIEAILARAARFIPRLKDMHFIRSFAGFRPYTSDGLPIMGPVDGLEGFIMAAGHEGDGIALAPLSGKLIAEYIAYKEMPSLLTSCRYDRFANSH